MSQSNEQFLKALANAPLKPVYLLCGQEPLLIQECADALRNTLKTQGYSERIVLETDSSGFDWSDLYQHSNAMSLFASQRIIDMRLPTGKPGKDGSQALIDYCANPPPDTVLLISTQEWSTKHGGKWTEAIEACGQMVLSWQVKPNEMASWLNQRLSNKGISASQEALQILLACVEGNLMAANQEVNKLAMQGVAGSVSAQQMQLWVADSSRFDVFKLIDACYGQDVPRMSKILHGLKSEGEQVPGLVPMISKELMNLAYYSHIQEKSRRAQAQMQTDKHWQSKQAQMLRAIDTSSSAHFESLNQQLAQVDKMSKGRLSGDAWVSLERVLTQWALPKAKGRLRVCA
jgi:DNA polymerase III subunit delta